MLNQVRAEYEMPLTFIIARLLLHRYHPRRTSPRTTTNSTKYKYCKTTNLRTSTTSGHIGGAVCLFFLFSVTIASKQQQCKIDDDDDHLVQSDRADSRTTRPVRRSNSPKRNSRRSTKSRCVSLRKRFPCRSLKIFSKLSIPDFAKRLAIIGMHDLRLRNRMGNREKIPSKRAIVFLKLRIAKKVNTIWCIWLTTTN